MDSYEFLDILIDNLSVYFTVLFFVFVFYIYIYRRAFSSVLDPLALSLLGSIFGSSVVVFLYIQNVISNYYFISYILTQAAFFIGFFVSLNLNLRVKVIKQFDVELFNYALFLVSSIIFIFSQLYVYKSIGIPIFMDSRLEVFIKGDGTGVLGRFIDVSSFVSVFLVLHIFTRNPNVNFVLKLYIYFVVVFFVITAILSGSKSSFMNIAYAFFTYIIINPTTLIKNTSALVFLKKNEVKIIGIGFIIAILILFIQSGDEGSLDDAFLTFVYRLVGYGDVYWYAYPNGSLEHLNGGSPILALFTDFFGLTRIVSWDQLPTAIGIDLFRMFNETDYLQGPNARHNVFGYVYFGYIGSVFFSLIIGFVVGFIRNKLFNAQGRSMVFKIFIAILYSKLVTLETDPMLALSSVNSLLIVFPILIILSLFLSNTQISFHEK